MKTTPCIDCSSPVEKNNRKKVQRCWKCYVKMSKEKPELHPCFKNGKTITSNGYISVLVKNHPYASPIGRVYEHRLVMEKKIGRYLKPNEVVHHMNEVKTDNRIENLLLTNPHEHGKHHREHLKCTVCGKPRGNDSLKRGLCSNHYQQWRRQNCKTATKCNQCSNIHYARGMCARHYTNWRYAQKHK